jgi:hypothetical protein
MLIKKDSRDRNRGRPAHHANIIVCDGDSLRRQTMPKKWGNPPLHDLCRGVPTGAKKLSISCHKALPIPG